MRGLIRRASGAGLLRRGAHAAPEYAELCLHTLTPGVAALSLYTWLADLRCRASPAGDAVLGAARHRSGAP